MIALLMLTMLPTASQTGLNLQPDQSKLDAISDSCHAPRAWLRHIGGDRVSIQPSPKAKYAVVDCLLAQLKRSPIKMNLGFVENEVYEREKK